METDKTPDPLPGPRQGVFSDPDFSLPSKKAAGPQTQMERSLQRLADDGCPLDADAAPKPPA